MIGSDCSPDIFDQLKDVGGMIQKFGAGLCVRYIYMCEVGGLSEREKDRIFERKTRLWTRACGKLAKWENQLLTRYMRLFM